MAFKFAARTLLELGKELISSDEVALYELIKNSIDAQSPSVQIEFNICLLKSDYEKALVLLHKGQDYSEVRKFVISSLLNDADEDSLDDFKNFIEDQENSVDFEGALRQAYSDNNWIEVRDDGHGMTVRDLDQVYLMVGTRSKRKENLEGAKNLGDKGVGRLSAMRLGDHLKVITATENDSYLNILNIDWTMFGHDIEDEVGDIAIDPVQGDRKPTDYNHGTTIRISGLNSDWRYSRLMDMLNGAIARMVDPFIPGRGNELLKVLYNSSRLLVPSIPSVLLRSAHATCKGSLYFVENEPIFSGTINYSYRNVKSEFNLNAAELLSLTKRVFKKRGKKGHAATEVEDLKLESIQELGPFELEIYWYNRQVVESINGLTGKASETRDLIALWSGGVMLFRNGFRVLPYGEPDDDWLELDKKAFGGSGFLLNRQQLLGKVTVHSSHIALSEQTNREGLIKSESSDALLSIMKWLMHIEFRNIIRMANIQERELRREEERAKLIDFKSKQIELDSNLDELKEVIPLSANNLFEKVKASIQEIIKGCNAAIELAKEKQESLLTEREQFIYLAGIGLMTEFIFHELDRAINHTTLTLKNTLKSHPSDPTLRSLDQQLITLHKRVSAFDEMSGEKRQSKTKFDLQDVVRTVISSHSKEFERHSINCEFQLEALELRAVQGMVIQIIENLVGNATYWLKQQSKMDDDFEPLLIISIDHTNKTLKVSDNGPGVSPDRKERIFEAFVTSKPVGQGRGLGLYICREMAVYHNWTLNMDDDVGRYRSGRLNTFVLDFKGA